MTFMDVQVSEGSVVHGPALVCGEVHETSCASRATAPPDPCRWDRCGLGAFSPNGVDCWIHWVKVVHGGQQPPQTAPRQATFEPGDPSWRSQSACQGVDRRLFFAETKRRRERAIAICDGCPVSEACLEMALAVPQARDTHGIFGGTTPRGRRAIREQRRAVAS